MKKDFSPEEKLLRLIKGSAKKGADRDNLEIRPALPPPTNGASSYYKRDERTLPKPASFAVSLNIRDINTKNVNPVLVIILICLLIYFLVDMIHNPYHGKESQLESLAEKEAGEAKEKRAPSAEPYSYYAAGLDGRNIFLPQESETSVVQAGPSLDEISANLSLIGIIAGERPQAIIEEKKAGKSYFLYKGGSVGQAKIMEIMEDRVVMEYRGETFELVL